MFGQALHPLGQPRLLLSASDFKNVPLTGRSARPFSVLMFSFGSFFRDIISGTVKTSCIPCTCPLHPPKQKNRLTVHALEREYTGRSSLLLFTQRHAVFALAWHSLIGEVFLLSIIRDESLSQPLFALLQPLNHQLPVRPQCCAGGRDLTGSLSFSSRRQGLTRHAIPIFVFPYQGGTCVSS